MRLRIGFIVGIGRKLRVCLVVRFSTDEQKKRRRSNESQVKYLKTELEAEFKRLGIDAFVYTVIADEAVSGELRDRPGIEKLRAGIARGDWDVIVCEDSSRIYRNYAFCYALVASAYDKGIRVICIGDDVDTAEQDWEERLADAQTHHAKDNKYTRRRLARAVNDLWEMGAAVGPLRSGYLRKSESTDAPNFDEIDPAHIKHILCGFRIVANRKDPKAAAAYLTLREVPKRDGTLTAWTVKNVISLVRNPIYRGVELYGVTKAKQKKVTGVTVQRDNEDSSAIRNREMPHLRIVSDGLWYRANQVIDGRTKCPHPPKGESSPMFGVPRGSRTPMSDLLFCGICRGKMYCVGTCYRCQCVHTSSQTTGEQRDCWNHATASRAVTHERIYQRVVVEMMKSEQHLGVLAAYLAEMFANETDWKEEEGRLEKDIKRLHRECQNWEDAIGAAGISSKSLVERIAKNEAEAERKEAELAELRQEFSSRADVPNRESLVEALHAMAGRLGDADRGARDLLKQLLEGPILAMPYRQLNSDRILLRAHFTLNLVALCPEELRDRLRLKTSLAMNREVSKIPCVVDLFETSKYVAIACDFIKDQGIMDFGDVVAKYAGKGATPKKAKKLAEAMSEAGITDPYNLLLDSPKRGSRWHRYNREAS